MKVGTRVIHRRYGWMVGYVKAVFETTDRDGQPNGHLYLVRYLYNGEQVMETATCIRPTPVQVPEAA